MSAVDLYLVYFYRIPPENALCIKRNGATPFSGNGWPRYCCVFSPPACLPVMYKPLLDGKQLCKSFVLARAVVVAGMAQHRAWVWPNVPAAAATAAAAAATAATAMATSCTCSNVDNNLIIPEVFCSTGHNYVQSVFCDSCRLRVARGACVLYFSICVVVLYYKSPICSSTVVLHTKTDPSWRMRHVLWWLTFTTRAYVPLGLVTKTIARKKVLSRSWKTYNVVSSYMCV